ncbi:MULTISPECIES: glycine--tRNA ligase subunit beta [unclassified Enterococcus]|uniref:glycine--tRNA ligase subunit beta n=1 Tax=unclassified Enterococcus TaxID=2608891 RepID=UPI0015555D48|nr:MULTISPECIES: glycine--tRNA ligase subunit beta [unclassified Enterococcus]MBS7576752.1 glycine--tRNA ligase subunit beta [Enterococcus sp. MMGLQ5-2]MBS7583761.1 glycine--tRNA ligase subunit beta [Enterococcus sp. MMGLQ5-1]NPD11622.1 glycine--tRNA ligase subunit beta [Enterococcus sp. MMGLQ5-1]NPD36589.1 glycine--tRNA ligase subunit beta [Enterococcus sp. MMGLQ5-2]
MSQIFLLEIGLEEMPAYLVTSSVEQLAEKTAKFLDDVRLSYDSIETFSTPRRLAIKVNHLADKQTAVSKLVKGPAKKIAQDDAGNWSKAALGFMRSQGASESDLIFKTLKGIDYLYVEKSEEGKPAAQILPKIAEVAERLTFPVSMHWANFDFSYIRPIHTVVALLDNEILPLQIFNIKANRISRGHRFLGQEVRIQSADSYLEDLKSVFVLADEKERKVLIQSQIAKLAKANDLVIETDLSLLEEVNNLVEYPTAFLGSFNPKYLALPEEVLVTSMRGHQRFFEVRQLSGELAPHFVSVRNGNDTAIDNVIRGNEKVLVARLEDAEFFWHEDQKLKIADLVEKLKIVTFHEKIGSTYEHMVKAGKIASIISQRLGLSEAVAANIQRASEIYKFDLVTNMVGEFDELQGIMGEKYALLQGEKPEVAQAIREHYLPDGADSDLPQSIEGAVLAISDKLETLLSFFTADLIPSGSNDPYALRRATAGVVRIIEAFGWQIDLNQLTVEIYQAIEGYQNQQSVAEFIRARIERQLLDEGYPRQLITAVLASEHKSIEALKTVIEAIQATQSAPDYKLYVENLSRVLNLVKETVDSSVKPELFENEFESDLYEKAVQIASENLDLKALLARLFELSPVIELYFDSTMVMVEDNQVKANRLATLSLVKKLILKVADFSKISVK